MLSVVPLKRIPKTWDNLPEGFSWYDDVEIMAVESTGRAMLVNAGEDDDDYYYGGTRPEKFSQKKRTGAHLKITKVPEGFAVQAFNLGKDYVFQTLKDRMEELDGYGDGETKPTTHQVVKYSESNRKKPAVKKIRKGHS